MRAPSFVRGRLVPWSLGGLLAALVIGLAIGSSTRAAYPGANGRVAFSDGSIGTINADGTDRASLTSGAYDFYPSWSPDGRRIAFSRYIETPSESIGVYVMNADGSGLQLITDPSMSALHPTWAPDGERLGFAGMTVTAAGVWSGPWDLHVINLDGTGLTRLTQSAPEGAGAGWIFPAWAPDGERIAAVNRADGGLYLIDPDGANPVRLTGATQDPAWSPDGEWLAFTDTNDAISLIRPDGTGQVTLTDPAGGEDRRPAWSPDGTKIVYESRRSEPTLKALTIMDADGTNAVRMEETTSWAGEPDWGRVPDPLPSPDLSLPPQPSGTPQPSETPFATPGPSETPDPSLTPQPSETPPAPSETPGPSPIPQPDGPLVEADGTRLTLSNEPYTFTGMNVYNANNRVYWCWYIMTPQLLGESFSEMGDGVEVMRAWFFQDFATVDGQRDWTAFDETLATAEAHGKRVIVTLGNQWLDCDSEGYKTGEWYATGYQEKPPQLPTSYRDFVAEVVERYGDRSSVLMWQLLNEAEVPVYTPEGLCAPEAHTLLKTWAADVSGLIKSIDPYHLVSIGTIGSGQCGAQYTDYKSLHDLPTVDLCEYHDYGTDLMPGDPWNGLEFRIQQCNELNKPLFIGETGITPDWLDGTLQARADLFEDKLTTQMEAGVVGEVLWAWNAFESLTTTFDIGPGDPVLMTLAALGYPAPWVTITTPAVGATYERGAAVLADWTCGPLDTLLSCDGDRYIGELIDTSTVGLHSFTVTATDVFGRTAQQTHDYVVADGDPRLTGTNFQAADIFSFPNGQVSVVASCDPDGTSTVTYTATGTSAGMTGDGPFPGEFTETGTLIIGPQTGEPGQGVRYGIVESFDAIFTIISANGTVHGTTSLGLTDHYGGYCVESDAGSPFAGANFTMTNALVYEAFITTSTGTTRDSGTVSSYLSYGCSSQCDEMFEARFVTDGGNTDVDADGDGVDDRIGTGNGAFDDGNGTTGSIVDTAGHDVLVQPDPDGVRITVDGTGTDKATFVVCGFTLRLAPGSDVVVSCGSITVRVVMGAAELVLGDGLTVVTIPEDVTATLEEAADGSFSLSGISGGSVTVVVDGVSNTVAPGQTLTLQTWQFIGFADPVDNDGVLNVVKAGQQVPLKWRLLDAGGAPVTNLASAKVTVTSLSCSAGSSSDQLEEAATGASGLQNLGDGYYQFNWRTPKNYGNSCKTMRLDIGDGVLHTALFQFTK